MTQVPLVVESPVLNKWSQIVEAAAFLSRGWVCRGQNEDRWTPATSIEREFDSDRNLREVEMLEHFVRRAAHWLPPHLVPEEGESAGWLGLMQHYGAPTRLLDVTKSPYVALYFAFETPGNHNRAVWAIDASWCADSYARALAKSNSIEYYKALTTVHSRRAELVRTLVGLFEPEDRLAGVFPVDPWKPDARQVAQQAMFLCASDIERTFMDNLAALESPASDEQPVVHKLTIAGELRAKVLEQLWLMNVTAASLFPDLGGLARSLRTLWERPTHMGKDLRHLLAGPPWLKTK